MNNQTTEVTVVNADFETLGRYENVLVYFPSSKNDKFLKLIPAHEIKTAESEKVVKIPEHYRRGDIIDGKFVTKHFFLNQNNQGQNVIADIEIVKKTDHARNDAQAIILNITMKPKVARANRPEWKIKIGTDKIQESDGYGIPGTKKFINFESN
ncbi:MAG: hypothetical protein WC456_02825 [Patescibacteria group bacterium]